MEEWGRGGRGGVRESGYIRQVPYIALTEGRVACKLLLPHLGFSIYQFQIIHCFTSKY